MKNIKLIFIFCIIILLLTSCLNFDKSNDQFENQNITILYDDESSFFQLYGDFIRAKFPNINITVIPSRGKSLEEVKQLISNKQPDIMVINDIPLYQQLIEENHLSSLTIAKNDNFKFEQINPMIIDTLTELGNGTLYGLVPFYSTRALFFNKDLFDENNISYPTDHMTWQEVLQTSAMFGGDTQVYGLDPWSSATDFIINVVGKTANLSLIDSSDLSVNVQSASWYDIWEYTTNAYKSSTIYQQGVVENNLMITLDQLNNQDVFLSGKAAMAFRGPIFFSQLAKTDINWGVVTEPVPNFDRNMATNIMFYEIITINNYSQNKEFALEVLKYLNSAEMTHIKSRQFTGIPARPILEWNGHDMSSLYKLKPSVNQMNLFYTNMPYEFHAQFYVKIEELYQLLMLGEIDLDSMLSELQMWTELNINVLEGE